MTLEQRRQIFLQEYNQLVEKTGIQISPDAGEAEKMGANWLIRPGLKIEPIPNWQPPPPPESEDEVVDE